MPTNQDQEALSAVAEAILATLVSRKVDRGFGPTNVVDVLDRIARSLTCLAFGSGDLCSPAACLGVAVEKAAVTIAGGLHDTADAVREAADAIKEAADAFREAGDGPPRDP